MKRHLPLLASLALLLAACNGGSGTDSNSLDQTNTVAETTTTEPAVEAVLLSYQVAPGDELRYKVQLNQHIEMSASGDPSLMGGEEVPGDASLDLAGAATFTHVVSDGPESGTYEVHITGEFTEVSVSGTVDGEAVEAEQAPDFASLEPIDVTVIVDDQGNLIQEDFEDPMEEMFGNLGPMGGGSPAPGLDPGQFIGPPFSDEEVTVGDTWTEEVETPGFTEEPVITNITSTVTGVEELEGTEVFVIETESTTTPIEFDLAQFFAGMFGGFASEDASPEEMAELEAMLDELRFLITVDDTSADSKTWFDAEAGLARQSDTTSATNISMDMNVPDEQTGALVGFVMDMTLDQDISYRLINGPAA